MLMLNVNVNVYVNVMLMCYDFLGVSTKLYLNLKITMQTYKELIRRHNVSTTMFPEVDKQRNIILPQRFLLSKTSLFCFSAPARKRISSSTRSSHSSTAESKLSGCSDAKAECRTQYSNPAFTYCGSSAWTATADSNGVGSSSSQSYRGSDPGRH